MLKGQTLKKSRTSLSTDQSLRQHNSVSVIGIPTMPGQASQCCEAKIAMRQIFAAQLPRNYTLTAGAILEEERKTLSCGERQFGRHFKRQFGRG